MSEPRANAPRVAAAGGKAAGAARAAAADPGRLSRGQLDELIGRLRQRRPDGRHPEGAVGEAGTAPAAAQTGAAATVPAVEGRRAEGPAFHPLSFSQQRLWFLAQLEPGSPVYNIAGALELSGDLDVAGLRSSLDGVLARHEALRATFALAAGTPVQTIGPAAAVGLPLVDLAALPGAARGAEGERLAAAAARRPFDLAAGPLLRALLLRDGPRAHLLVLAMHHVAADGRSLEIFLEDLAALYDARGAGRPAALPQLPIRFVDFARREREEMSGPRLEAHLDYWRGRLAGAPAALELPCDRPRPPRPGAGGGSVPLSLPAAALAELAALARRRRATPFLALLAAIEALLCRISGQQDLLVGTVTANRDQAETARVVGCFVNTLVLRADLSGSPSFAGLLDRVRAAAVGDFAHQELPFEKLIEELRPERWLSRTPLFQVALAFQERQLGGGRAGGLTLTPRPLDTRTAKFDLLFEAAGEDTAGEGAGAAPGRIEYSAELFDRATIVRLVGQLAVLLVAAAARPETPVGELPLVTAAERRQLLAEWNDTASAYPRDQSVHALLEEIARRRPDAVAAVEGGARLTYGELDRRANRLAHRLRRLGVGPEVPVALLCERSLELVVAIAAILKSGGAYVPLDPGHPPQRLALILAECGSPVLLAQERLLAALPESALPCPRPRIVRLEPRGEEAAAESDAPLGGWAAGAGGTGGTDGNGAADGTGDGDRLAYVMYTSGSTGVPKGVSVTHRAVVRLVRETRYAAFGAAAGAGFRGTLGEHGAAGGASDHGAPGGDGAPGEDGEVFLLAAPPAFDASTFEIWGPLLNGGRLVVFPPREPDLEAMGAMLAAEAVTTLWLTAGLFHQEVESHLESLRPLRQLLAGGDVLAPAAVRRVLAELPGLTLINGYGPTEGVTFSCCQTLRDAALVGTSVAIGRPIANTTAYVLDLAGGLSPIGVAGELAIGGDGLARGYLGRPGETAGRFVPDPFGAAPGARLYRTGDRVRRRADGSLEFLGRFDRQVKIRGFRVEPGEIESALAGHPRIEECAVMVRETAGDRRLVAYVVPRHPPPAPGADAAPPPGPAELRAFLRDRLPEPLVPAAFVTLAALPLTANGKVDRAALPEPEWGGGDEAAGPWQAPAGAEEEILAAIYAELLGAGPGREVGAGDDFFALGGHSLLATQAMSRVRSTFGVELPLRSIFEAPTVSALAELVRQARGEELPPAPPISRRPDAGTRGTTPLSFAQERLWFLAQLDPESAAYHLALGARLSGRLDRAGLAAALSGIVRRHEALRTVFVAEGEHPAQRVEPARPVALPLVDLACLPAARAGADRGAAATALAAGFCERRFDLAAGPLLRPLLLRLAAGEHLLVLALHHIVADGWSLGVLVRDLAALHPAADAGVRPLPELAIQYADFARWQREWLAGDVLAAQLAYWRRQLAGLPPLELPRDRLPGSPGMPGSPEGKGHGRAAAIRPTVLPGRLTAALAAAARHERVTLFMALLAGLQAVLGRWAGQDDVAVGSPVANRNRAELEPLIGFFVNTLVMRTDLSGDPTGAELLARAREVALGAYAHQDLPFAKLVEELQPDRDLEGTPFFRVMLVLQNAPLPPPALPGLILTPQPIAPGRTAKFDLTLTWTPAREGQDGRLDGEVEYARGLYDGATVARLLGHLETLLAALAAEPARRLSELPLLTVPERAQLLVEWNDSAWARGAERQGEGGWGGTLPGKIAAQAARRPEAVAVAWEGGALSYGELERQAGRLAGRLRRLGAGPDSLVGICLERGPALLPALLAALRVGGAYLPLDPGLPRERLAAILTDAGPRLVLADAARRELLAELAEGGPLRAVYVDQEDAKESEEKERGAIAAALTQGAASAAATAGAGAASAGVPDGATSATAPGSLAADPALLAYVLFTSGSTGRPKGVAVPHGALMNVLGWYARELELERRPGGGDGLSLLAITTLSFDIAAVELLLPLALGGRVELAARDAAGDGARLRAELERTGASLLQGTPVTWQLLAQSGWPGDGGRLLAVTAGEALTAELAERLLARLEPAGTAATDAAGAVTRAVPAIPATAAASGIGAGRAARPGGGLWNLYGPTEAAIYAAGTRVAAARLAAATGAPIGGPVANTWLHLLDRGMQPVPIGVAGGLYIGGAGLARGYVNRPELTAERFVPDPFADAARAGARLYRTGDLARRRPDGQIDFMGRLDHQVKLRGYRIELGEIEAVLARHPAVRECAVKAHGAGDERQLVAYVAAGAAPGEPDAPAAPETPSVLELRAFLARRLPSYMVPGAFVALARLPHTPSGKVDRKALPPPAAAGGLPGGAVYQAPRGAAQEVLLAIWSELLGAERVERQGAAADFFALGGHSLLATRLVSRVRDAFGLELPVRSVFEAPTVAAFAAAVEARRHAAAGAGGAAAAAVPPPIVPQPEAARRGPLPLSFSQERLWFLDRLQPGNPAYNMPAAVRLRGRLDARRLARGLAAVARRHESLRTTFHALDGQPFQRVAAGPLPDLPAIDLAALPPAPRAVVERRLTLAEAAAPFDLERGPLLRARLLLLGDDEQVLLLNMHHIVSDGWSVRLIIRELAAHYAAGAAGSPSLDTGVRGAVPELPPLAVQYADYAHWQRRWLAGEALARQLAYWRQELGGELPVLDLPIDWPRPAVQTFQGGAAEGLVPPALAAELRSLSRREGASFFMTLLAGFAALLGRHSGQEELLIGVPIAGRNRAEVEPLVGFFLNSLVLRIDLSGRPTFRELLRRVRRTALDAYAHQDLPFEKLLEELQPPRDLSRTPLFQVYFNFQNLPEAPLALPGVTVEEIADVEEPSKFDLTLYLRDEGGEVGLRLVYNAGLFAAARIADVIGQYGGLLARLAERPDAVMDGLSLVTPEAARLLPDPAAPLDDAWIGAVHELAAASARRAPHRLAVADPAGAWTYGELERQGNRLAHRLLAAGVGGAAREDVVAIHAHRSAALVWAVLGTLKAGAAFVILDPAYPPARLAEIVRLARPRACLELAAAGEPAPELVAALAEPPGCLRLRLPTWQDVDRGAAIVEVRGEPAGEAGAAAAGVAGAEGAGERHAELAGEPAGAGLREDDPGVPAGPDRLAFIAFTSGSTGVPKGILGRHGPLSHFLPWQTGELGMHADDRFSLLSGLSHDPLQRDLFTPLYLGAAICIPDPAEIVALGRLAAWMRGARVSVAHLTPAMGQLLTEEPEDAPAAPTLPDLRRVLLVGDVLTRRDVDRLRRLAPGVSVVNLYGSTETQRAVGFHVVAGADVPESAPAAGGARAKEILPLGRGMQDVQLLVLGRGGHQAGIGEVGEISVRSPHLARGYLGDAEATAARFLVNPSTGLPGDRLYRTGDLGRYLPDGEVAFAGRADAQVKVRGFRIELGEIEARIGRLPAVREAVVLATAEEAAARRLMACVVPRPGAEISAAELRAHLRRELPAYMLPAAFLLLPSLPLNPNGKVDRKALLQLAERPAEDTVHHVAPRNETEAAIAAVLREVLKLERVGVEDNFFELGGNSLLLVQAQSRLQAAFQREIPVFELFNNPTVRDLARFLGDPAAPRPGEGGGAPAAAAGGDDDDDLAAHLAQGRDRVRRRLAKTQPVPHQDAAAVAAEPACAPRPGADLDPAPAGAGTAGTAGREMV